MAVTYARGEALAAGSSYPNSSWALGIVVPGGATLQDGGKLGWGGVTNVTAIFTLPNITLPDGIVYAVVSVMTADGTVLQAAAGVRPGDSSWYSFSWSISGADTSHLNYQWILNGSKPEMKAGTDVAISIFWEAESWHLKVVDEVTGNSTVQAFPPGAGDALRSGDQEVFALESYSRSAATFEDMGNLTLRGILFDGERVTGGTYAFSDWDPAHTPLFVVGSSGTVTPSFISFGETSEGDFVWGYSAFWGSGGNSQPPVSLVFIGGAMLVLVMAVAVWIGIRRGNRKTVSPGEAVTASQGNPPVTSSDHA